MGTVQVFSSMFTSELYDSGKVQGSIVGCNAENKRPTVSNTVLHSDWLKTTRQQGLVRSCEHWFCGDERGGQLPQEQVKNCLAQMKKKCKQIDREW